VGGQWVYTSQYGWIWIPYGNQYTYEGTANDASPTHTCTTPATDGCGWPAPWVWAGVPILTLAPRVRWALAGTLASTGRVWLGRNTAAAAEDTVLVVVTVAAIAATLVVPHAVVSVVTAASAVATAEAMVAAIADNDLQSLWVSTRGRSSAWQGRLARERFPFDPALCGGSRECR